MLSFVESNTEPRFAELLEPLKQLYADATAVVQQVPEAKGVLGHHPLVTVPLSECNEHIADAARTLQRHVETLSQRCNNMCEALGLQLRL